MNSKLSNNVLGDIEEILKNLQLNNDTISNIYSVDTYRLIHVPIPDKYRGCSLLPSLLIVYSNVKGVFLLDSIYRVGYNFELIENSYKYFVSDVRCTFDSEIEIGYSLYRFTDGKLIEIYSDSGYDKHNFYRNLYTTGYLASKKEKGYSDYKNNLQKFKSAINDTVVDYSDYSDYVFYGDLLVSCKKKDIKRVLLGAYNIDSLLTKDYIKINQIGFNNVVGKKIRITKKNIEVYSSPGIKTNQILKQGDYIEILVEKTGYYQFINLKSKMKGWLKEF